MKLPRCKICGTDHRLGGCPSTQPAPAKETQNAPAPNLSASPKKRSEKSKVEKATAKPAGKRSPDRVSDKLAPAKASKPDKRKMAAKSIRKTSARNKLPARKRHRPGLGDVGGVLRRVGRPLAANVDFTLAALEPWIDLGVSRSTYFRREKAKKLAAEASQPEAQS